jgi:hypothetical protein
MQPFDNIGAVNIAMAANQQNAIDQKAFAHLRIQLVGIIFVVG